VRKIAKNKVKYFFCFCLLNMNYLNISHANMEKEKVVVVGAGLAGLTAAYRLKQAGKEVEVYEARPRPGGRVLTLTINGSKEEMGGKALSDGGEAKHIIALALELGLTIDEVYLEWSPRKYFMKGQKGDYLSLYKDIPSLTPELVLSIEKMSNQVSALSFILDHFFQGQETLRSLYEIHMACFEGSSSDELSSFYVHSFLSFLKTYKKESEEAAEGKTHLYTYKQIKGGNSCLVEALADSLQGHIYYRCPLRKIKKGKNEKMVLAFEQNVEVEASCVILALPCSTLRDVEIEENVIPDDQLEAIKTLNYGTNAKLLLPIERTTTSICRVNYLSDAVTWFNKDEKVQTVYYGGRAGNFDSHSELELATKLNTALTELKELYPDLESEPTIGVMPENTQAFSSFTHAVGVSWACEEFSKGSYSNCGVGQENMFNTLATVQEEKVRKVFRPIGNHLFFAGEHTSLEHPATLEGAVESGETAARMVLKRVKF